MDGKQIGQRLKNERGEVVRSLFFRWLVVCLLFSGVSGAVGKPFLEVEQDIPVIAAWGQLVDEYERYRDANYPLVVPGSDLLSYGTWESVLCELTSFKNGSWFWFFEGGLYRVSGTSTSSAIVKDVTPLLIYEDVYSGEIVVAEERLDGAYVEVYSQKTLSILDALALGASSYKETARRRIAWCPVLVPFDYSEPIEVAAESGLLRTADFSPLLLSDKDGISGDETIWLRTMTLEKRSAIHSPTNMWIEMQRIGPEGNTYRILVHVPAPSTNRVDIFSKGSLLSTGLWAVASGMIEQDANHQAIWTNPESSALRYYYRAADAEQDSDGDGLPDGRESFTYGSNPHNGDTDQDSIPDGVEVSLYNTDPLLADTDGDGLSDGEEIYVFQTSAHAMDSDGDLMPDQWEVMHQLNPLVNDGWSDPDEDGIPNAYEYHYGTLPFDIRSTPAPVIMAHPVSNALQQAIADALVADSEYPLVGVMSGTYTGTCNQNLSIHSNRLVVLGLSGNPADVVFDGENSGSNAFFSAYSGACLAFSGITVENISGASALSCEASRLLLVRCDVKNVSLAPNGGAARFRNAAFELKNCSVAGCAARTNGGAFFMAGSTGSIQNCSIRDNRAVQGGGIYATSSVCKVAGSILWNNITTSGSALEGEGVEVICSCVETVPETGVNCTSANPLLSPDASYIILSNSPCINQGDAESFCKTDMTGSLRDAEPDMGAYEWTDADADGSSDQWEQNNSSDPNNAALSLQDSDNDGFLNIYEEKHGADPYNVLSTPAPTIILQPTDNIQAAINAAADYDIIQLSAGVFQQNSIRFNGKKVMVCGVHCATTIVDCAGAGFGFAFNDNETRASVLSRIQIKNTIWQNGHQSGIEITNGSPTILSCRIVSNQTRGVICTGAFSYPLFRETLIERNQKGGLYLFGGKLWMDHCEISRNTNYLGYGAGMEAEKAEIRLDRCVISHNRITGPSGYGLLSWGDPGSGGGLSLQDVTAELNDCDILGNDALTGAGLAVMNSASHPVALRRCKIRNNETWADAGGGVKFQGQGSLLIESCAVIGNYSATFGGGLMIYNAPNVIIRQTTLYHNGAANGGGAMLVENADPYVVNSIFWQDSWIAKTNDLLFMLGGTLQQAVNCCFAKALPTNGPTTGCFTNNPLLDLDAWHIRTNASPCIGRGTPNSGAARDLDGQLYTQWSPDVGCDERSGTYDFDSLPDSWELKFFGTTDYEDDDDYDFDGLTNLQEYQLNLNPANPDTDGDGVYDAADPNPQSFNTFYDLSDTFEVHYQKNTATGSGTPQFTADIPVTPELAGNIVSVKQVRVSGTVDDAFKIDNTSIIWTPELSTFSDEDVTTAIQDHQAGHFTINLYDWTTNTGPNNSSFDGTFTMDYLSSEPVIDLVGYDADRDPDSESVSEAAEESPGVYIRVDDGDPVNGNKPEARLRVKAVGRSGLVRQLQFKPYYRMIKVNGIDVTNLIYAITNDSNEDVEYEVTLNQALRPGPKVSARYVVMDGTNILGNDLVNLVSVKMDLDSDLDNDGDIDDDDEPLENVGLGEIIRYNDNDDPAGIEDDLQYMSFSVMPKDSGKIWFTFNAARLRLWEDQNMTTNIPVGDSIHPTWDLDHGDVLPAQIYVEALATTASNAPEQIVLHRYWGGADVTVSIRVTLTANLGHFAYFDSIPDYIREYRGPDAPTTYRLFEDQLDAPGGPAGATHNFVAMMSDDVNIRIHDARAAGHAYYGDVLAANPNAVVILNASYFETTWPQGIAKGICVSDGSFMTNSRALVSGDDFYGYRGWAGRIPAEEWSHGIPHNQVPPEPPINGSLDFALGGLLPLLTTENGNMVPSGAFGYYEAGSNLIGWSTNGVLFFAATIDPVHSYNPPIDFSGFIDRISASGAAGVYEMDGSSSIAFCHQNPFGQNLHLYGGIGERHWPAVYTIYKSQRISNYVIINSKN